MVLTDWFQRVAPADIAAAIQQAPATLRIFRTILGLTTQEFAASSIVLNKDLATTVLTNSRVKSVESGSIPSADEALACSQLVDRMMTGVLFPSPVAGSQSKIDKPDTSAGWESVRAAARGGVNYSTFLHQRHYGGAFRQLLDATSAQRGNILEEGVEELLEREGIPFYRTRSANQEEIRQRFGISARPAPDFVVFQRPAILRGILECKGANDGGTARDKAARYSILRAEGERLGGIPVFAMLGGLGWARTRDALGPVVRATDGRVFTLETLDDMLTVEPLASLRGSPT